MPYVSPYVPWDKKYTAKTEREMLHSASIENRSASLGGEQLCSLFFLLGLFWKKWLYEYGGFFSQTGTGHDYALKTCRYDEGEEEGGDRADGPAVWRGQEENGKYLLAVKKKAWEKS